MLGPGIYFYWLNQGTNFLKFPLTSWILLLSWILLCHQWGSSGCPHSSLSSWGQGPSDDGPCLQRSHSLCPCWHSGGQTALQADQLNHNWVAWNKQIKKKSWNVYHFVHLSTKHFFLPRLKKQNKKRISYSALNSGITKSMASYCHAASSGPGVFNRWCALSS